MPRREGSEAVMITDTKVPLGRDKVEESEEKHESSTCDRVAIAHVSTHCSYSHVESKSRKIIVTVVERLAVLEERKDCARGL